MPVPHVHSSAIDNSQDIEIAYMSIDRYMDKEDMLYMRVYMCVCVCVWIIYNGILLNHEKEF